jgi:hypothetical protein
MRLLIFETRVYNSLTLKRYLLVQGAFRPGLLECGIGDMGVTLSINAPALDRADLQALTRDLCTTLQRETDLEAKLPEREGGHGLKGDPITIGTIVLALVTSGAAAKLFEVLRAYFERNSKMEIDFERDDGKKISIKAENLATGSIEETIDLARQFLGG